MRESITRSCMSIDPRAEAVAAGVEHASIVPGLRQQRSDENDAAVPERSGAARRCSDKDSGGGGARTRRTTLNSSAVTTARTNDETSPIARCAPESPAVEFDDGASDVPFSNDVPFFPPLHVQK
uniref:Uncharacterized protein n=1 Tax=Oryza meridionalis TaxID=40149 RepID=A0A0E0CL30_9ORYZ